MDEEFIFDRINFILEGSRLPYDIRDYDDLDNFLKNKNNKRLGAYGEIRKLYNEMANDNGFID